jgi:hypothetical protein
MWKCEKIQNHCTLMLTLPDYIFYVTNGNIMYLTDASRFLISCVVQHYAPVVGWGGGGWRNRCIMLIMTLETNIKIASARDRTRVACVTGGHST